MGTFHHSYALSALLHVTNWPAYHTRHFPFMNQIVHYLSPALIISHANADAETILVMQITLVHYKTTWYVFTVSSTAGKYFLMKVAYKKVCTLMI